MIHMREYNSFEKRNVQFLVNKGIDYATIQITQTGINKSTLDATAPVRAFFKEHGIHDYERQAQGPANKVFKETYILTETGFFKTQTALYRPVTKQGDPRLWIYGFTKYAHPDDIFAMIENKGILYVIILTQIDIEKAFKLSIKTMLKDLISDMSHMVSSVSGELLGLIKDRMSDWTLSEVMADTGIGRTIESCLGIAMNSSKAPDYKGIELKSFREFSKTKRAALFTQSPNWQLSKLKNAKEICAKYGYERFNDGVKRLNITLRALKPNPQRLALNVNLLKDLLEANEYLPDIDHEGAFKKVDDVVVWQMVALHRALLEKHHETFWVDVENRVEDGREWFRVKNILHTKNPIVNQFDILMEQGHITVDFLLCRSKDGKSRGNTYSFKIEKSYRKLLFPQSETYIIN